MNRSANFEGYAELRNIILPCFVCLVLSAASDQCTQALVPGLGLPLVVTIAQLSVSSVGGATILLCGSFFSTSSKDESDFELARKFISTSVGLIATLSLGICQAVGFLATNLSLGLDDMSFHHCIKASEPLFTAVLSTVFLRQRSPLLAYASLAPIMLGIILCTAAGVRYSAPGLAYALASNACFSLRSVFAAALLRREARDDERRSPRAAAPTRRLSSFALYVLMSAAASAMLVAVHLVAELRPAAPPPPPPPVSAGLLGAVDRQNAGRTAAQLVAAGSLHLLYNAASFQARRGAAAARRCRIQQGKSNGGPGV